MRGQGEGGKGWKSMPELISSIDNFAKGLTAPIHRPRARRGCPHHRGLPEGPPQPSSTHPSVSEGINGQPEIEDLLLSSGGTIAWLGIFIISPALGGGNMLRLQIIYLYWGAGGCWRCRGRRLLLCMHRCSTPTYPRAEH